MPSGPPVTEEPMMKTMRERGRRGPLLAALGTMLWLLGTSTTAQAEARVITPDYAPPEVVYDFYFDDPNKIESALYWIRSLMNPL
jgi:hypothetical protein